MQPTILTKISLIINLFISLYLFFSFWEMGSKEQGLVVGGMKKKQQSWWTTTPLCYLLSNSFLPETFLFPFFSFLDFLIIIIAMSTFNQELDKDNG